MIKNLVLGTMVAGLVAAFAGPASADNRVSNSKKGSLLVYSKVELRWSCNATACIPQQDTFIDLSNDDDDDIEVQFYFVNGDPPTDAVFVGDPPVEVERRHDGWNSVDCQIPVTGNQPLYMSLMRGGPCQPFTILDPGFPPGRPDAEFPGTGERVLRGFVLAWAVNPAGEQIRHNHLVGDAILVNYRFAAAAEYNAYAFQAYGVDQGDVVGTPGTLSLDGTNYDIAYDKLLMDFYCTYDTSGPRGAGAAFLIDTDVTLHPVSADLRQDTDGPVTTKAKYDLWNENEVRFSGTEKCITCWDQTLVRNYPAPNHMFCQNLQTFKGKARIDGMGSTQCPLSVNAAILGIQIKLIAFINAPIGGGRAATFAASAINMVGQGEEAAEIQYDIIDEGGEANTGSAGVSGLGLSRVGSGK